MAELPRTLTPIGADSATALMVVSLGEREDPDHVARVAQHLLSLVWIETAHGRAMTQHNWGNLAGEYQGNFWRPPWFTVDESSSARNRALHQRMLEGKAPSKFRAYPDRGAGLEDFLNLVYQPRYASMISYARTGDTQGFANAVHDTGYCPDDACRGERTFAHYDDLARTFRPLLGLPSTAIVPVSSSRAPSSGLGALALLWLLSKGLGR